MRRHFKNLVVGSLLLSTLSYAFAGCVNENRGTPHPDGGRGTQWITTQKAGNTWDDWIWRGQKESVVFHCPWSNAQDSCFYLWGQSRVVGKSSTFGLSVGGGGSAGSANNHTWHALANASFNMQKSSWSSTENNFEFGTWGARGMFIEPIVVQKRRWEGGYMRGGWVQTHRNWIVPRGQSGFWQYCYRHDANIVYGTWGASFAEGPEIRAYSIRWHP